MPNQEKCRVNHIAFIMDGNGRWAKKRLMPREFGHLQGAEKFKEIVRYCRSELHIKYITVYAFSTENWKRPEKEVKALIKIFRDCIEDAERKEQKILSPKSQLFLLRNSPPQILLIRHQT